MYEKEAKVKRVGKKLLVKGRENVKGRGQNDQNVRRKCKQGVPDNDRRNKKNISVYTRRRS